MKKLLFAIIFIFMLQPAMAFAHKVMVGIGIFIGVHENIR